jgi:hypothetical protein
MTKHATMQYKLYDFIQGALTREEHAAVAEHLRSCPGCAAEEKELRALIAAQGNTPPDPAADLPEEYWRSLLDGVDRRIATQKPHEAWYHRMIAWITPAPTPQYRFAVALGAILIVTTSALVTWTIMRRAPQPAPSLTAEAVTPLTADSTVVAPARLQKYLHRSRTLLVGVANMKVPQDQPADLNAERAISRELVNEARALRQESLDLTSARLVNDLEKIQIELANMRPGDAKPGVDMIRHGIESKNLLFKLRMAESVYKQVNYAE